MMAELVGDVKYAVRQWRRSPVFALTALVTLALGIGANTAIFTLFQQVFLRELAVQRPGDLVQLHATGAFAGDSHSFGGDTNLYFSYPMYKDLRDRNTVFTGVLGEAEASAGVVWGGASELDDVDLVTGNYFDVLGVKPAAGRVLMPGDEGQPGANPVVVLSYDYWQTEMHGSAGVVGKTLLINGHPFEIVGVAQQGFASAIADFSPSFFVPLTMRAVVKPGVEADFKNRQSRWMPVVARLKPGVTMAEARASLQPLWHGLRADELKLNGGHNSKRFVDEFLTHSTLELDPDAAGFSPTRLSMEQPLMVLLGMVLLLAAMTAANVASLLLVRAASRGREIAVRCALGASRARVVRQLVLEGLLLGLTGGAVGAMLAPALARLLIDWLLDGGPFSPSPSVPVLAATLALAVVVSLAFSLAPAVEFLRGSQGGNKGVLQALRGGGVVGTGGGSLILRRASVMLQIGLSVVLLSGAGLFVRTLHNLRYQPVGLSIDRVVTFRADPSLAGYGEDAGVELHKAVARRLAALPGVMAVGGTTDPDLRDDDDTGNITVEGHRYVPDEDTNVEQPLVTPGYFAALRVPLLAGRLFTESDRPEAGKVAVVNEALAKKYFGSAGAALGHYIAHGAGDVKLDTRIVGVVADAKHKLRAAVTPTLFEPFNGGDRLTYYVRTAQAPVAAEASLRAAVHEVEPKLVIDPMRTMDEQVDRGLGTERALALLGAAFSLVALLTTGIGLYGVLAYATEQRTREIGIRMALGALRGSVVRLVVADTVLLAALSVVIAVPVAALLARLAASVLFGVEPFDPLTVGGCVLLAGAMVGLAAAGPAWRAATVEPSQALRSE